MTSGAHRAPSGMPVRLLMAAAAVALGLDVAHPAAGRLPDATPPALRTVTVEDWSAGTSTAPGPAAGRQAPQAPGRLSALVGRVDIRGSRQSTARRPDASRLTEPPRSEAPELRPAVVYLESLPAGPATAPEPMRGRIDQRDETFVPHVLAVTAGSVVDFPNNDGTYHNVFSLSRTRRFDLGRYAQGRSESVRFDRAGVVRVFCDIHSHMSAYVLVFSHPFFATTGADGRYRIDGVPPGRYTVSAWYEGESRQTRAVTLPASGGPVDLDFNVP